jgi:uncharacterized membrane protein
MPWLKLLHIVAVIVWCGALLYLPALVAASGASRGAGVLRTGAVRMGDGLQLLRTFYTVVATPAALVAIASGTWIFATRGPLVPWLMAKLALVGLLVLAHGACGVMVLRAERGEHTGLAVAGHAITVLALLCLAGIAALVLSKPGWP